MCVTGLIPGQLLSSRDVYSISVRRVMLEHVKQTSDWGLLECVWPVRRAYTWNAWRRFVGPAYHYKVTRDVTTVVLLEVLSLYHQDILMVQW